MTHVIHKRTLTYIILTPSVPVFLADYAIKGFLIYVYGSNHDYGKPSKIYLHLECEKWKPIGITKI